MSPRNIQITGLVVTALYLMWLYHVPLLEFQDNKRKPTYKPRFDQKPQVNPVWKCENTLSNLTQGKWVKRIFLIPDQNSKEYKDLVKLEREVDEELEKYRVSRGIYKTPWRSDHKCGYKNFAEKPSGSKWPPPTASWCDPKNELSCCSNELDGMCVNPIDHGGCNCNGCVDVNRILHAEVSKWMPADARCRPRNFSGSETCDVMKKFSTIHLVGDSFIRKFYRAFLLTLTSDLDRGAYPKRNISKELKKLCVGRAQFYWGECNFIGISLSNLANPTSLCGGRGKAPFSIFFNGFFNMALSLNFHALVKSLTGKAGSLIILGVGLHMNLNFSEVTERYIGPAMKFKEDYYKEQIIAKKSNITKQWPMIMFTTPDMPGLVKPSVYQRKHGREFVHKYSEQMKLYCKKRGIIFMDFRHLTSNLHSYDGTHYGIGLNMMKVQFLLNYFHNNE